jgi:hypothetical protein
MILAKTQSRKGILVFMYIRYSATIQILLVFHQIRYSLILDIN